MARKIENDDLLDDGVKQPVPQKTPGVSSSDVPDEGTKKGKKEKRKVVVINVPKRKKPLRTPSHIIRITMVWCFIIVLFLLSYPFLQVRFYITEDLDVTPYAEKAYSVLATQQEVDAAAAELQKALDGLVEAPKEEESKTSYFLSIPREDEEQSAQASAQASGQESDKTSEQTSGEESAAAAASSSVREISTVNYNWSYTIAEGINAEKLEGLIDKVKKLNRAEYTEESMAAVNDAVFRAQKILCANVFISQNALQMMLGGSVAEAFGAEINLGNTFLRSICTFGLGLLPLIAICALLFDKKRIVKNIIVLACCLLALVDIFATIYPFIGIGAVLSIVMYIIILIINFGGMYARQQEKYIVEHPEKEAEFSEKHPHFVKALINEKSFGTVGFVSSREKERQAAKNAQKRNRRKK